MNATGGAVIAVPPAPRSESPVPSVRALPRIRLALRGAHRR